ncbi:hypothetical protein ACRAWG_31175 [Methylobacterium sp. P31]
MGHRKSILAATLAVFGLVAAAHIARSGKPEAVPEHVQAPALNAKPPVKAMAWVDPPARADALSVLSDAVVTTARATEVAKPEILDNQPRATQALQPKAVVRKATVSRAIAHGDQASAERRRKAEVPRRHRMAQRRIRLFQASLTRRIPAAPDMDEQAPPPAPAPKAADQSDPIRILIHGLGLDG